jgi:phosphohistidine phosphatase
MDLYFIRHGIAVKRGATGLDDEQRPLTPEGRRKTTLIAQNLEHSGIRFEHLLVSPLVRAQQTAVILEKCGLAKTFETYLPLAPGGSLEQFRQEWLSRPEIKNVALVGHEPDLSGWAEMVLLGEVHGVLQLKKAGLIKISLEEPERDKGKLVLVLSPKVLLETQG